MSVKSFFAGVPGSLKGYVNGAELYRSILTSLGSGSLVGVAITVATGVAAHTSTIFPNPSVATVATMFLTLILDLLRRQSQGTPPANPPTPK